MSQVCVQDICGTLNEPQVIAVDRGKQLTVTLMRTDAQTDAVKTCALKGHLPHSVYSLLFWNANNIGDGVKS